MSANESQRRLRFFVELRVRFILLDGSMTGPAFVSSLSLVDLFVETDRPLPVGTVCRMRLYIPGRSAIDLRGIVQRHGEGALQLGMRITFTDMDEAAAKTLVEYLERPMQAVREKPVELKPVQAMPSTGYHLSVRSVPASPVPATAFWDGFDDLTPPQGIPSIPDDQGVIADRFDPDAFRLFLTMEGKMVQFLETLDGDTARSLLVAGESASMSPPPGRVPAPVESVDLTLLDPEHLPADALDAGVTPVQEPSEPADEAERLRRKYSLDDSLFDVEVLKEKYSIDEDLFEDGPTVPPWPDAGRGKGPSAGQVARAMGQTPEQRAACAAELRTRGEDALRRGLVLKAASELGLAVAFLPEDATLVALHEKVRLQANAIRAEELHRQGLQQAALGDPAAAAKLLLAACDLVYEKKAALAAAKILLGMGTPETVRQARVALLAASQRNPKDPDVLFLQGKAAEAEGFKKGALRAWQKALEIAPHHGPSKAAMEKLGKKA
jgi:hypothetical protein